MKFSGMECANRPSSESNAASPSPETLYGCGKGVTAEHSQIIRALERGGVGDLAGAHRATHLTDGIVFVPFEPLLEIKKELFGVADAVP